jgi:TrmH family RNA methyltransferase
VEKLGRHSSRLKELRRRVRDRRPGEVIVDGRRLVSDLVRWGVSIGELYLAADLEPDPEVVAAAERLWQVDAATLAELAPTRHPQGVLAVVDEPGAATWRPAEDTAIFLEGVQDPGNLGAVLRSAAGLGAAAVLLSEGSADPFHPAAVRGSAGACFRIPVERRIAVAEAAQRLRLAGGGLWAAGASGTPIEAWRPARPTLLLLGAEGAGLSAAARDAADGLVTIPLERGLDSLNLAVAAGILLERLRGL